MRFDTPVFFQTITAGAYDAESGNHGPAAVDEVKKWAAVTDAGTNTMKLVYGDIKEGALVIRLQRPYLEPFDRIRVSKKIYKPDVSRGNRVFIVHEVQ